MYIHCDTGDWEIAILYDGKDVEGSPFTVRVHDPGQVRVSGLNSGVVGTAVVFASKHNFIYSDIHRSFTSAVW